MKLLVIALSSVFLISCGKSGELSNTKEDKKVVVSEEAKTMKLSKKDTSIDAKTTTTGATIEAKSQNTQPMYDTGLRPSNSK